MKRYWGFVLPRFYPNGGVEDEHAGFDSAEEASDWVRKRVSDEGWGHSGHVWDAEADQNLLHISADDDRVIWEERPTPPQP